MELALPSDLTRREALVLFASWVICDQTTHVIPGGKQALARATGITKDDNLRVTIRDLCKRGFLVRENKGLLRVVPPFFRGSLGPHCENCNTEIKLARSTYCKRCSQAFRADRVWQVEAVRLAVQHVAKRGKVDPPSIAVAVNRPLWKQSRDDDNQSGAVVPFLLAQGFIGDDWRAALKEVLGPEEHKRLRKSRRKTVTA